MPSCVWMVCSYYGINVKLQEIIRLCFNKTNNGYGIWPQAIAAAHTVGLAGAVILINDFAQLQTLLRAGIPIIASLRFKDGALSQFPFQSTSGHLVVVRGIWANKIMINDPAHSDDVKRYYDEGVFMDVWLKSRPEIGCAVGLALWRS